MYHEHNSLSLSVMSHATLIWRPLQIKCYQFDFSCFIFISLCLHQLLLTACWKSNTLYPILLFSYLRQLSTTLETRLQVILLWINHLIWHFEVIWMLNKLFIGRLTHSSPCMQANFWEFSKMIIVGELKCIG